MHPVIGTLADLVRINSINPAYQGGVPEAAVADYMEDFFAARGIPYLRQEVLPGRPNFIACLAGRDPSRRLVFEAHMDTAGVAGMEIPPFEPAIRGGRLYGRGSCDTKAGLAAMMHALAALGEQPPCEVWLCGAADEEHSFRGVLKLCEGLRADGAVVAEPTSLRLVVATKGCLRFRIRARGVAAHSSKPHLGVNAIAHMALVVLALEDEAGALARSPHPLLGPGTLNVGTIHGGTQINIVPDDCAIEVDRRLLPGEDPYEVLRHYRELVAGIQGVEARVEDPLLVDYPLETPPDAAVARAAASALASLGLDSTPAGVPYGSDASKLARAGVPAIVAGPGTIDQAHAAEEYVECAEVERAVEFYRRLILEFE